MEDKGKMSMVIILFLLIILGSVFVGVLGDQNWLHRNTYRVNNETLSTVSNLTTLTQVANYPIAEILYVTNETGTYVLATAANYTRTTDSAYYMYNGKFILNQLPSEFDGYNVNISYKYYPSGYVRQSTARVLLNLVPLFFVIAILLFVVMPVLKKYEIF